MQYTRTALIAAITALVAPSNEDVAPPELFTVLGALSKLPANAQYVIYDLEESAGTLVPSEELIEKLVPSTVEGAGVELANWDGSQPDSMGYGDLYLTPTPAGFGLTITMAGSSMSSAATVWVVPVTAEHPAVNAVD